MSVYLFPKIGGSPLSPVFEFDGVLREAWEDTYKATTHAVEDKGTVSDYVDEEPTKYEVEGIVTAHPFDDTPGLQRIQRVVDALRKLAKLRQLVTVVSDTWVADAVILKVRGDRGVEDGQAFKIKIDLQTIEQVTPQTVQIPPSRLASSVRRRSGAAAGGQGTPRQPTAADSGGFTQVPSQIDALIGSARGAYGIR